MTELRTAGILLAAGASRRMGTNKLLLEFEGEALVRRACHRALAAGLDPVVVVLGHEAQQVRAALQGLNCEFAMSADVGGAMSSSIHAGLLQLPASTDAAVILLADMPYVTADMMAAVRFVAARLDAPLVVSSYAGTSAPPILFRRRLFAELIESTGENVGRVVAQRHRADAALIKWPAGALRDIDTADQFAELS